MIGPSFVGLRCPGPCLARQWHPWRRPHRWPRSHRWPQSHRSVRRLPLEAGPPWSRPQAGCVLDLPCGHGVSLYLCRANAVGG